MITFLFWNLGKNPVHDFVARLARRLEVDIIILAESNGIEPVRMLTALNPPGSDDYYRVPMIGCEKLEFYTRFTGDYFQPIFENSRLSIRHLKLPGVLDILVAATHLPDKRSMSNESQGYEANRLAEKIQEAEQEVGHRRTILVGDLNMNPFEAGMVAARGLHAIMDRGVVQKAYRTVQGVDYHYFYNPMWSLMGDASPGAPGSYYYAKPEHVQYFWNMFDQVLIRPALMERFNNEHLQIVDSDGEVNLRNSSGIPNASISDHLPIVFKLNL